MRHILGVIVGITLATIGGTNPILSAVYTQPADAFIDQEGNLASEPKAPMIASGENLYIVWWTN